MTVTVFVHFINSVCLRETPLYDGSTKVHIKQYLL